MLQADVFYLMNAYPTLLSGFRSLQPSLAMVLLAGFTVMSAFGADRNAPQRVDQLVERGYQKHQVTPNEPSTDQAFLRRAYLDIIGRVPTYDEAKSFLDAEAPNKRGLLIAHLLNSDGYVSHFFNYWADLLRVKSRIDGEAGAAYADWVKTALRKNTPYNQMVHQLLTADGYVWDNGAVGYFMRDAGMPLDNMSNTTQVFLGTQLVCAQCHNHPFDKWTQKEYYEMAAYTYGVETEQRVESLVNLGREEKRINRRRKERGKEQHLREALGDLMAPLRYKVAYDDERNLSLPTDYKYDDAKPGEMVRPDTIFGRHVSGKGAKARESYAEWLTSPDNPRFTKVIVNRLWKKVMGVGLIEPVDDFRDGIVEASENRELLEYLERQMIDSNYDIKAFLSILYNTRTYQREATPGDIDLESYRFPGPVLRRLTAEQIWDSLLTNTIPNVDQRLGGNKYLDRYETMRKQAVALEGKLANKQEKDIVAAAMLIADAEFEHENFAKENRKESAKAREAGNSDLTKKLTADLKAADKKRDEEVKRITNEFESSLTAMPVSAGTAPAMMRAPMDTTPMMSSSKNGSKSDGLWKGYSDDYFRASELSSPAPNDHFLRRFGQSDRETIENAEFEPSVPQVLALLNGKIYDQLVDSNSVLSKGLEKLTTREEKQDYIFLSMLTRLPTEQEREILENEFKGSDPKEAAKGVIWSLLNTQEFLFVQ